MFGKLAQFQGLRRRPAVPSAARASPCNDNRPVRRLVGAAQLSPRPVLVCGWRRVPATGRLECFWQVVPIDSAAEEPAIRRMIERMLWLLGTCRAAKQPFRLAAPVNPSR